MPEGDTHRQLVQHLTRAVMSRRPGPMSVFNDGQSLFLGGAPPPALGDSRPDIYALDSQTKHVIIGEAKSAKDIENLHTERQLSNYFSHLAECPTGELLIAVPYVCAGTAHRLCLSTRKKLGLGHVPFEISGWFLGTKPYVETWNG